MGNVKIIDAHQQFWRYELTSDDPAASKMNLLHHDFLPDDLLPLLAANSVESCVALQNAESEKEMLFLLDLANRYPFIKGVIGWIDLKADELPEKLQYYSKFPKLKGFRYVLQRDTDGASLLNAAFKRGISYLSNHNFSFDLAVWPDHLKYACELIKAFPNQRFVINDLGKPPIAEGKIVDWSNEISRLALQPNAWCKISGLVTQADWKKWKTIQFERYLDVAFQTFGPNRLIFGSDWPICLVAADYKNVVQIIGAYLKLYPEEVGKKVWSDNAMQFYQL